jgi:hypothetical protein
MAAPFTVCLRMSAVAEAIAEAGLTIGGTLLLRGPGHLTEAVATQGTIAPPLHLH